MPPQTHSISLKVNAGGFDTIVDLALTLRWSWSHVEDQIWEPFDPELWELTHNPGLVLMTASISRLKSLMAEPDFRRKVEQVARIKKHYLEEKTWFERTHPQSPLSGVAYLPAAAAYRKAG